MSDIQPTTPGTTQSVVALPDLPEDVLTELKKHAQNFMDNISQIQVNSPAFNAYIERIDRIGSNLNRDRQMFTNITNPATGKPASAVVQQTVTDLNQIVKDLSPENALKLTNFFGFKARDPYGKMFTKYADAETQIRAAIKGLYVSQDVLTLENATLIQEEQELLTQLNKLNEYMILVDTLQEEADRVIAVEGVNSPLATELTYALNHKKQDLLVRTTVITQAYMALNLIRDNNIQLQRNIDAAKTTTVTALRTAQTVASALGVQANVLNTLNKVVSDTGISVTQANMETLKATRDTLHDTYNQLGNVPLPDGPFTNQIQRQLEKISNSFTETQLKITVIQEMINRNEELIAEQENSSIENLEEENGK